MSVLTSNQPTITTDGFILAADSDLPDLRDQIYRPTLQTLLPRKERDVSFFYKSRKALRVAVRNQGDTPTCTGQALAALVDILRQQQSVGKRIEPASACMLYRLATEYEVGSIPGGGLLSLRSIIKAFYHYGVCTDGLLKAPGSPSSDTGTKPHHWTFRGNRNCDDPITADTNSEPLSIPRNFLTVDHAKAARKIPLGAYYRINPRLNDYHAALNETGAILVSAHIHDGWVSDRVRDAKGEIRYQLGQPLGVHAFVIVGYNDEGFLVLNSWGKDWGGYKGFSGIALWHYSDWADSIHDGWVLCLGVSTPSAFRYSIGEQGLSSSDFSIIAVASRRAIGSTPGLELLGHFAHLDDGDHVTKGPYATSVAAVNETIRYLGGSRKWSGLQKNEPDTVAMGREKAQIDTNRENLESYRGVLLWLGGGLEGIKDAVTLAVNRKEKIKAKKLYPYTILWCNDFVGETTAALARIFNDVKQRIGTPGPALDLAIENACQGVGRAFWRDVSAGAEHASIRDHHGADTLDSFLSLDHLDIHLVVDGAGAIFLDRYLYFLEGHPERDHWLNNIRSVDFITPTIGLRQVFERTYWRNFFGRFDGKSEPNRMARLWVPCAEDEARLCVDAYGKSILHLIANSFERRLPCTSHHTVNSTVGFDSDKDLSQTQRERGLTGLPLLGMAIETSGLMEETEETEDTKARRSLLMRQLNVCEIPSPGGTRDRLSHQQLVFSQGLFDKIRAALSDEAENHRA